MHSGWPALENHDIDGWLVRRSHGVTRRANSVLPAVRPRDPREALHRVESLYRERGLAPAFQISAAVRPIHLDGLLAERGYRRCSPTLVQVADTAGVRAALPEDGPEVELASAPDRAWMDLWCSVDGPKDCEARAVAHRIMTSVPARYASIRSGKAAALAVARLAHVGSWGGLFCTAVHPEERRRGLAATLLRLLLADAAQAGIRRIWLQVTAENRAARNLYAGLGFVNASAYHYRVRPPG